MSNKSKDDFVLKDRKHTQTDLKLTYEEYKRLRNIPFEELSEREQELRMYDFNNRLNIGMEFIRGMFKGYISKSVTDKFPDDDPLKEETEALRIMFNHKKRTNMKLEA